MTHFRNGIVSHPDELFEHYGEPVTAQSENCSDRIGFLGRGVIGASPYLVIATRGEIGQDFTAQGGPPGFAAVHADNVLLVPDHHGDPSQTALRNLLARPDIGVLFFVPHMDGAYAVKGMARISVEPKLKNRFKLKRKWPRSVIIVDVHETQVHPGYALSAGGLWRTSKIDGMPTFEELQMLHKKSIP